MIKLSDTLKTYSFTLTNDYTIIRSDVRRIKGVNFVSLITYHKGYFEKECRRLKDGDHFETELHIDLPNYGNKPYKVSVNRGGEHLYIQTVSLEEIIEVIESVNMLEQYAYTDQLTGALNRHAYDKFFTNMLLECDRHNYGVGLLFVDIDDLKSHNKKGYNYGDEIILHTSKCIQESIRRTDLFIRQGGDEFFIVFSLDPRKDFTLEDMAMRILRKVRRSEGKSVTIGGYCLKPGEVRELAYSKNWKKELNKYHLILDKYIRLAKKNGKNRIITPQGELF